MQKLKLHILSLGGIKANADFVDSEDEEDESDDDDDDNVEVSYGKRISWDDITF